ncbi:MAG: hypothetical protein ONB27_05435, partial [candidate division KSB1 bacterium]|nr:hypothetical protein [candidate division KSB1 bacterium]
MTSKRQMIVQEIIFLMSIVMCLRTDLGWTQQRSVIVDQAIVQTTTVTSKKLIDFFVEDFMIPEKDVKKMVIYDLA